MTRCGPIFLQTNFQIEVLRFTNLDVKQNFEGSASQSAGRWNGGPLIRPLRGTFPCGGRLHGQEANMKTVTIYTDGACSGNPAWRLGGPS